MDFMPDLLGKACSNLDSPISVDDEDRDTVHNLFSPEALWDIKTTNIPGISEP